MKVKMTVSIAGHAMPEYGIGEFSFVPGEVLDLDDRLALAWLSSGHASPVDADPETATLETGETATLDKPGRRRRG